MSSSRTASLRLRAAVQENDLALVQKLRYKTELRNTDSRRLTSLAWAALCGSEETFEWLLFDAGHDEDELSRDSENGTILHMLASVPNPTSAPPPRSIADAGGGSMFADIKWVKELQARAVRMTNMYWDAFPDIIDWSNSGGKTALHIACQSGNAELVRTLCELGADVDLTDVQGNTPLHYASAWNALPCVRELLEAGCQHAARNNAGFTALEYAYSASMRRDFEAALKEIGADRRQQRRQQLASDAMTLSDGSSGVYDLAGRRFQQLRGRSSFGTFTSEDSAATTSPAAALSQSRAYAHLRPSVSTSTSGSALSSDTASPARNSGLGLAAEQSAASPLQRQQAMAPPQLQLTPAPTTPRSETIPTSPLAASPSPAGGINASPVVSVSANTTPMTPSRYQRYQQEQLGIRNRERANSGGGAGGLNGKASSPALMQRSRETSPEREVAVDEGEEVRGRMRDLNISTTTDVPPMSPTIERLQGGTSIRVASSSTIGTMDTITPGRPPAPHRTNSDSTSSASPTPIAPAQPRFSLSLAPPGRPERSQRRPSAGSSRGSSPGSTVRNGTSAGVSPASSTLTLDSDAGGGRTSFESFDSEPSNGSMTAR